MRCQQQSCPTRNMNTSRWQLRLLVSCMKMFFILKTSREKINYFLNDSCGLLRGPWRPCQISTTVFLRPCQKKKRFLTVFKRIFVLLKLYLKNIFFQEMVKEVLLVCKDWCDHRDKVDFGFKGKRLQQMGTILSPRDFFTVTETASRGRQKFPAAALIFRWRKVPQFHFFVLIPTKSL